MKPGRKANGNGTLWRLAPELQEEIYLYSEAHTLEETVAWCGLTHGVKTSVGAVSAWRGKYGTQRRYSEALEHVEELKTLIKEKGDVEASKLDAVMSGVFMSVASSQGDAKTYVALARLMLEGKRLDLESRRISILEEKARELDELKDAVGKKKGKKKISDMDEAERAELIKFVDERLMGKA
jgi:hypothetical protein